MIELQNISKSFGDTEVLNDISLQFPEGKILSLIGPSGCGKSTLLRTIIGLTPPSSGTVLINDTPQRDLNTRKLRHKMGYVIQEGGLFPHLSARDNITLMPRYLGWSKNKISERLKKLRNLTHLQEDLLDKYPKELSGGQRQRVSLMRALMLDPEALLLDEPLGALDPIIRAGMQEELLDIFQKVNKTVILVTHDMGEAAYFGDEVALMKDGELVQKDPIQELVQNPKNDFVSEFIHAQQRNHEILQDLRNE